MWFLIDGHAEGLDISPNSTPDQLKEYLKSVARAESGDEIHVYKHDNNKYPAQISVDTLPANDESTPYKIVVKKRTQTTSSGGSIQQSKFYLKLVNVNFQ